MYIYIHVFIQELEKIYPCILIHGHMEVYGSCVHVNLHTYTCVRVCLCVPNRVGRRVDNN